MQWKMSISGLVGGCTSIALVVLFWCDVLKELLSSLYYLGVFIVREKQIQLPYVVKGFFLLFFVCITRRFCFIKHLMTAWWGCSVWKLIYFSFSLICISCHLKREKYSSSWNAPYLIVYSFTRVKFSVKNIVCLYYSNLICFFEELYFSS